MQLPDRHAHRRRRPHRPRGDAGRRRSTPGRCSREALGAEVWVKHENHTPVGAFKVRGGLTYFDGAAEARAALPAA
ncbi:MAG: hypothetical protein MZW92_48040 [Comamonadaceae bacterium]|nr:hypothetical protein [Comamonadaceae bacterium]